LCISSQVGCTLTCRFCHTGTQRLARNLNAGEIVAQVLLARDELKEWTARSQDRVINNIVFMGMGDPLFNYEEVAKAVLLLSDPDGISIGKRRITVSTSGVVPFIHRCGAELGVNLAVSLHAPTDELRDTIVPLNRKYPIKELLDACRNYPGVSNSRRITFEYVMLKGVNDRDEDCKKLIKLLRDVPSKINLIPFNPWPGAPFECSTPERIEEFGVMLNEAGYVSPIRKTRGQDIMAACGQLKSASLRLSAAERAAIAALQQEKDVAQGLA
jgi:23S rRNA (adenine2503-C2)-methyltransferase